MEILCSFDSMELFCSFDNTEIFLFFFFFHCSHLKVPIRFVTVEFLIFILHGPKNQVLVVCEFMTVGYCHPFIIS